MLVGTQFRKCLHEEDENIYQDDSHNKDVKDTAYQIRFLTNLNDGKDTMFHRFRLLFLSRMKGAHYAYFLFYISFLYLELLYPSYKSF